MADKKTELENGILAVDETVAPGNVSTTEDIATEVKETTTVAEQKKTESSEVSILEAKEAEERAKLKEQLRSEIQKEDIRKEIGGKVKSKKKYLIVGLVLFALSVGMMIFIFCSSEVIGKAFESVEDINSAEGLALLFLWIFLIPIMLVALGIYFIPFFGLSIGAFFFFVASIRGSSKKIKASAIIFMILTVLLQLGTMIGVLVMASNAS